MSQHRILVTGGTGFIGKHLVTKLAAAGHYIRVLNRKTPHGHTEGGHVEHFFGDFLSPDDIKAAVAGVDTVYHLAVTTVPGWSNEFILYDAQTNLMGSLNLIQAAAEAGVRRFIFVSSGGSVYGVTGPDPIPEDHPTAPISAHGVSKLAIEKYLDVFHRKTGLEYRIARAGNPYGEGQDPGKGQGFIAYALGQLARHEEIVIWGDGSVVRDFFHVSDLANALLLLLNDTAGSRIYNVGSGEGKSLNEIVEIFQSALDRATRVKYENARPADVPFNTLAIDRINTELGWEPHIDLTTGLKRSWNWVKTHVYTNDLNQT